MWNALTPGRAIVLAFLALGIGEGAAPSIGTCRVLPAGDPWNQDVSALPLHPSSDAFIESIGRTKHLHPDFGSSLDDAPVGIPFVVVAGSQPKVPVTFDYADESDPGPYPLPPDAPIEGGASADGDRHVLVIDGDACLLYELFAAHPENGGTRWKAGSGAIWDLTAGTQRPRRWTSADAAGLPIFPGLVRFDEIVEKGQLHHAVRFTVSKTQSGFIPPAGHYASSDGDPRLPPMGLRLRMKRSYDCSRYSREAQVLCAGLKTYGLIVADNGGDWFLSGAPDPRWSDDHLDDLRRIAGDAFEAVDTGAVETY